MIQKINKYLCIKEHDVKNKSTIKANNISCNKYSNLQILLLSYILVMIKTEIAFLKNILYSLYIFKNLNWPLITKQIYI